MDKRKADAMSRLTRAYVDGMSKVVGDGARVVIAVDPNPEDGVQSVIVLHAPMEVTETLSVLMGGIHTMYVINQDLLQSQMSTKH